MSDAKSVAKRIKEAGLKRLRWYCQMCEKQCRDENGFKNHCTTAGHLRNMELFQGNSTKLIEDFSHKFEKAFMDVLMHGPGRTKRVFANNIYQEMIQDKQHVHMNATKWDSLASFVMHLGATGKCHVDQDERGWWIRWIDPEARMRENLRREKEQREADLQRRKEIKVNRQAAESSRYAEGTAPSLQNDEDDDDDHAIINTGPIVLKSVSSRHDTGPIQPLRQLDAFMDEEERQPAPQIQQPRPTTTTIPSNWMTSGLVVKILSSKIHEQPTLKYQKGVVLEATHDTAELCMLSTGLTVSGVPERICETVLPAPGGKVQVVRGQRLGQQGYLKHVQGTRAIVEFKDGKIESYEFDGVCKTFE